MAISLLKIVIFLQNSTLTSFHLHDLSHDLVVMTKLCNTEAMILYFVGCQYKRDPDIYKRDPDI
jgi:hypothetical protein